MLFRPEKGSFKKVQNNRNFPSFFFVPKNRTFYHLCSLGKSNQKRSFFSYILDKKECFLDKKNEVLKKSKNSKFSKGLSPWFMSKIEILIIRVFWQINPEKIVFRCSG